MAQQKMSIREIINNFNFIEDDDEDSSETPQANETTAENRPRTIETHDHEPSTCSRRRRVKAAEEAEAKRSNECAVYKCDEKLVTETPKLIIKELQLVNKVSGTPWSGVIQHTAKYININQPDKRWHKKKDGMASEVHFARRIHNLDDHGEDLKKDEDDQQDKYDEDEEDEDGYFGMPKNMKSS